MAKVLAPNREYQGVTVGVAFAEGVGYAREAHQVDYLLRAGYTVVAEDYDDQLVLDVIETFADAHAADPHSAMHAEDAFIHRSRPVEDGAMTAGLTDDQRAQIAGPGAGKLIQSDDPYAAPRIMPGMGSGAPGETTLAGEKFPDPLPTTGLSVAGLTPASDAARDHVTATGSEGVREAEAATAKAAKKSGGEVAKSPARKSSSAKKSSRSKSSRSKSSSAKSGGKSGGSK